MDHAACAFGQMRVTRSRVEERTPEVDAHHPIEVPDGCVDEPRLHADARVVDQDVEAAEVSDREHDRGVDVDFIRCVSAEEPCFTVAGSRNRSSACAPSASSRPVTTIEAPSARNRSAIANPIPEVPPVTSAALPSRRRIRRSLPSVEVERRSGPVRVARTPGHLEETGKKVAIVHRRIVGLRDHLRVEIEGVPDMKVHGNLVDHECEIEGEHGKVAEISKKWFRLRRTASASRPTKTTRSSSRSRWRSRT